MRENIVRFFASRHLLVNIVTVVIIAGGVIFWQNTQKEELPNYDLNRVMINVSYPGASPVEVEYFVTRPIEDELRGVDGIYRVTSTSSSGISSIIIEIDEKISSMESVTSEIRNTVMGVDLPDEVKDLPRIRQFRTSQKAIIDIGLYMEGERMLDDVSRRTLQESMLTIENRLMKLPHINSIDRRGYLKREFRIEADPKKMVGNALSFTEVMNAIKDSHIRRPAGDLENRFSERVIVRSELDTPEKLMNLTVRGTFEGQAITLRNVARVDDSFERAKEIFKVNGHEGIFLRVRKNGSYGILDAIDALRKEVAAIQKSSKDSNLRIVHMDDGSRDVRNRLSIVSYNGAIGFVLIILVLLAFLNAGSAFWVALGIPLSLSFAMIIASIMGYSINNITLAGVIIVLGMVVDDAIIVAENIFRLRREGMPVNEAAVKGTAFVLLPITASIITSCIAFMPLLGFEGRFGDMNAPIPVIVSLVLIGSLIESIFILPAHISMPVPDWLRNIYSFGIFNRLRKKERNPGKMGERHWFDPLEDTFETHLARFLRFRLPVLAAFLILPVTALILFTGDMKFVMFPREEVAELLIHAEAESGTRKEETEKLGRKVEDILEKHRGKHIVAYRTAVAKSRWGSAAEEHRIMWRVELIPLDQRGIPLKELKSIWKKKMSKVAGLKKFRLKEWRFGQEGGSPIEIAVQDNNDTRRRKAVDSLTRALNNHSDLHNVEVNRPVTLVEHHIRIDDSNAAILGINPSRAGQILRSIVDGTILYELIEDDTEIDVRLTAPPSSRRDISSVLSIPVSNKGDYLVPLGELVNATKIKAPNSINRQDFMRTTTVYADIQAGSGQSPLSVAEYLEANVFPKIESESPTTVISFEGEVKDTRESSGNFRMAVIMVLVLIFSILAILFGSLVKPLIIMSAIPFAIAGIIIAFRLHGINYFGFYGAIGALGLSGVVINDAIVMVVRLQEFSRESGNVTPELVAAAAKTRLRAVLMTTLTTVAGLFPTAYGIAGYDSMLSEMMLAMAWGLIFATFITLILIPVIYSYVAGMTLSKRKSI